MTKMRQTAFSDLSQMADHKPKLRLPVKTWQTSEGTSEGQLDKIRTRKTFGFFKNNNVKSKYTMGQASCFLQKSLPLSGGGLSFCALGSNEHGNGFKK